MNKISIQEYLVVILNQLQQKTGESNVAFLTKEFHVWPDFHGNRSPVADPFLKVNYLIVYGILGRFKNFTFETEERLKINVRFFLGYDVWIDLRIFS